MRNPLRRLTEILNRPAEFAAVTSIVGQTPPVSFRLLADVYTKDPHVFGIINSQVLLITGPSFHLAGDPEAVELAEKFNARVKIREVVHTVATELLWAGNSFWLLVNGDPEVRLGLQHVPLTYVTRIKADPHGRPTALVLQSESGVREIEWEHVVHFYLWRHDRELFGTSLLRPFVEARVDHRGKPVTPPVFMKWKMERNLERIWDRYAQRFIYRLKNVSREKVQEFRDLLSSIEAGDDIVMDADLDVLPVSTEIKTRFPEILDYYSEMILYNFLNITPRLFTTPGFTYASAQVAKDIQDMMVRAVQQRIKEVFDEQIYPALLKLHNLSDKRVEFIWGLGEKPTIELDHILKAAYAPNPLSEPLITRDEARKMLLDLGWPLTVEASESTRRQAERFDYPRWVETLDSIILFYVNPASVDLSTIRYLSIDSDRGIQLAVADVMGDKPGILRRPVALIFARSAGWTLDSAKAYYNEAFPQVWEKISNYIMLRGQ